VEGWIGLLECWLTVCDVTATVVSEQRRFEGVAKGGHGPMHYKFCSSLCHLNQSINQSIYLLKT